MIRYSIIYITRGSTHAQRERERVGRRGGGREGEGKTKTCMSIKSFYVQALFRPRLCLKRNLCGSAQQADKHHDMCQTQTQCGHTNRQTNRIIKHLLWTVVGRHTASLFTSSGALTDLHTVGALRLVPTSCPRGIIRFVRRPEYLSRGQLYNGLLLSFLGRLTHFWRKPGNSRS